MNKKKRILGFISIAFLAILFIFSYFFKVDHSKISKNIELIGGSVEIKSIEPIESLPNFIKTFLDPIFGRRIVGVHLQNQESLDLNFLKDINSIKILSVRDSNLLNVNALETLSNLEELNLSNNNLNKLPNLKASKNLRSLDISWTKIEDINAISELQSLRELNISNTNINDITAVFSLIRLESLNLEGISISDIQQLKKLNNLKYLRMSPSRSIPKSDLLKLLKSNPTLKIDF